MSEKKEIKQFFQEQFEHVEVAPDPIVWSRIEAKLQEKKKRRIVPFWWQFTGIAAAFVIGFWVYTTTENGHTKGVAPNEVATKERVNKQNNQDVVSSDASGVNIKHSKSDATDKYTIHQERQSENAVVHQGTTQTIQSTTVVAESSTTTQSNIASSPKSIVKKGKLISKTATVISTSENQIVVSNAAVKGKSKGLNQKTSRLNAATNMAQPVAYNSGKKQHAKSNSTISSVATMQPIAQHSSTEKEKDNPKSIASISNATHIKDNISLEATPSSKTENTVVHSFTTPKNDSLKIAKVESNALEELLKEKEKKTIVEQKINRWQLSSNVAPIYFSSLSQGSPLDARLASNDKNYKTNYSYGLGINYGVTKKVKLKAGLNVFDVNYDTNGILYYQNSGATSKISNLSPNQIGMAITIENFSNITSSFNKFQEKKEGRLNQKIGYYEIPLEASYQLLNRKFGITIVGGMSTLILKDNDIYLLSNDFSAKIGEANNLNKLHFSGNLGLGFKYEFLRRLEAKIEPVFKYQVNTFSRDAGEFKPFILGVYTGFNFAF